MRRARPPTPATRDPPPRLLPALVALTLLPWCAGAGVFELQVLEFSNYRLQVSSGACCGPAPAAPAPCAHPCRTRFTLCLKEYQSAAAPGACSFGRAASPVLGTDSFTLAEPLYTLALPFSFRWTRSFTLILRAYDDSDYADPEAGLIEEAWWSGIVEPGAEWHALRHAGSTAALAYRVRVSCAPNYYNTTCTSFCRPRDDKFGHYSCDDRGDKRCLPGWRGDNCEKPVCKEGCHATHGRCDRPGDCDCRPGWRGELCAQCQPYPGCKHGYCNGSSWDCTCDTNWGGILCDQDLNYCGTHEPCAHGGTCENTAPDQYLCTCAEGFSGADCERVDNPCAPQPCTHGACELSASPPGFTCSCDAGWTGALCDRDEDDCASEPCLHGGACTDLVRAYRCTCAPGYSGAACELDVDECAGGLGPCVNAAACNNTAGGYWCACLPGWDGHHCDTNVDDCAGQCLHGATCIDLVDDYHCACAAGYAGRTCAVDVDECARAPCRHGGECVDLVDDYRCICPVGFSGKDCELPSCGGRYCPDDRDHCAGAPCVNGAACYTAQSDYYCHCAPGWQGKNCSQRAAPHLSDPCVSAPCRNNGTCLSAPAGDYACVCPPPYTGDTCGTAVTDERCGCDNGGTCVRDARGETRCACTPGWEGALCSLPVPCPCEHGGRCVETTLAPRWTCACPTEWSGARCELLAQDPCASSPCRHGACTGRGARWTCECLPGWVGGDCSLPAPPAAPDDAEARCRPACAPPARCRNHPPRCLCPDAPRHATACLELLAGLEAEAEAEAPDEEVGGGGEAAADGGWCGADNGTWWWGCNACRCAGAARPPACTRLWCGLPDCLAPLAQPCRSDEVCVPAAPALCLRPPCAPLGECRRVAGRRVEPPALPAPAACWPGAAAPPPAGCARARLLLARERLAPGAHVERACLTLRRALAAQLLHAASPAPPAPPLALLCDLAADDDDAVDLALWGGDEDGGAPVGGAVSGAVRALSELVSRRRLGSHPLLAAVLRLSVTHASAPDPQRASPPAPALLALAGLVPLAALALAAVVLLVRRRRAARRAAERSRRCDEEKSNNLQNEENLRRYANPLRGENTSPAHPVPANTSPAPPAAPPRAPAPPPDDLPRAHSLYKTQNADARNLTPPRDKELTLRALPPPRHPPPPERLTVLV